MTFAHVFRAFACGAVLATAFSLPPVSPMADVIPTKGRALIQPKATALTPVKPEFGARLAAVSGGAADAPKKGLIETVWNDNTKLLTYITVWYLGNIWYNIYNKKALNMLGHGRCHWALAGLQLLVGVLFVLPMWLTGVRPAPKLTLDQWKTLFPVGFFNAAAHGASVLALGAGAVSFGQIVKAGEPVFAAATGAVLLKEFDHPVVYLALLPIIAGVSLASLKELTFTWTALIAASAANQAAALKNVVTKGTMKNDWAKKLGPQNTYAVVTILSLLATIPMVLFADLKTIPVVYKELMASGKAMEVLKYAVYSGLNFYIYNEFSFLALSKLSPVTHSVANTLKRVVIIVASCIVFQNPMTLQGAIGSGVAVLGTLLYSLAKKHYAKPGSSGH